MCCGYIKKKVVNIPRQNVKNIMRKMKRTLEIQKKEAMYLGMV